MEIFMRNVSWNVDVKQVEAHLAKNVLHTPLFEDLHSLMNFHVHLHPDRKRLHRHGGTGILTLPSKAIGDRFLQLFGETANVPNPIALDRKTIKFSQSNRTNPRKDVQDKLLRPYMDPYAVELRERRVKQLTEGQVKVRILQFGWECRDYVFSVECEKVFLESAILTFSEDKRELCLEFHYHGEIYVISMAYTHINEITLHTYLQKDPVILFSLNTPPIYKHKQPTLYDRLSYLPIPGHERVAPYSSLAIRLVCATMDDLDEFRRLSAIARLHKLQNYEYPVEKRNIFSVDAFEKLDIYLRRLNWCISFQVMALLCNLVLDVREILELMPTIVQISNSKGKAFTAALLRAFSSRVDQLYWNDEENVDGEFLLQCLYQTQKTLLTSKSTSLKPTEGSLCDAFHVTITPTAMKLDGPSPERSNRVIRAYQPEHHESFLRVSFLDESKMQYRFDREINGPGFIQARVGPMLKQGLTIAGRTFNFLAYSQSALKEHAVWFVKPFREQSGKVVTAKKIVETLGDFTKLDPRLVYCPARYAARLSQAFTATDAVQVEVEEILPIDDIVTEDGKYQFTDGVGTISAELAEDISTQLRQTKRRGRGLPKSVARALQIRFMGSKGMVSVDYKLRGRVICIRPSMTKFEASEWSAIEIARSFDRPGMYFLNRPLIMLLEGLGVPYEVFESYQRQAVQETKAAGRSFRHAANGLFEHYGLGASFRVSSVLLNLAKLGLENMPSPSYSKMLDFATNHVLRDFKNHARIPVPRAWTLVGVADVHRYLQPNQIFACVKPVHGATIYLEGPVLISRSPTIHPGDAMIVHAIGRPPQGTCFHIEPLHNTVVFSTQGDRPVPSCLGGGDLDGDIYNLIPLNELPEFTPKKSHPPASYEAARKKVLDRPSTMDDIADFVMEYINSDVVGIIAINWLLIADQSDKHIFDADCMKLANLHSDAVDYPKSGQPVSLKDIPKPPRVMPDWHAPETVDLSSGNFYESPRAIGRLFRDIDLPVEKETEQVRPRRRKGGQRGNQRNAESLVQTMRNLNVEDNPHNEVFWVVEEHVGDYIDTEILPNEDHDFVPALFEEYTRELHAICMANALSHSRTGQLTEEEAIVGTIVQKTSQRRVRKDAMAKLRESTDILVRGIREALTGDAEITDEQYLERSWIAWVLASEKITSKQFGAESFGWIALGAIFDAIREIEEHETRIVNVRSRITSR